jgi:cytochrome c oxidase subunit 2
VGLELPKRARRLALGATSGAALLFLSGCDAEGKSQLERLAMPVPATKEAQHIYDLWQWAWLAAILTGILVWGLIFYAVIAYRRRSESEIPVQVRYNLPIEILYTVAPVMMVIVFFFFTVKTQDQALHYVDNPDDTVTVVGQQWSWTFNYTDVDSLDGKTVHDVGTTAEPPTLYLVKDSEVNVTLYSPDVIHSFWVPDFLFKMDVVPGRQKYNHFTLTPDRSGTFEGRCAELCGVYHSRMLFDVKVVSQDQFDAHMRKLESEGLVGLNLGGSEVNVQDGLEPSTDNSGTDAEELNDKGGEQ